MNLEVTSWGDIVAICGWCLIVCWLSYRGRKKT